MNIVKRIILTAAALAALSGLALGAERGNVGGAADNSTDTGSSTTSSDTMITAGSAGGSIGTDTVTLGGDTSTGGCTDCFDP